MKNIDMKEMSNNLLYIYKNRSTVRAVLHDFLIIHEMLRKKGKATQHNRKTKEHNTTRPRQYFSKKKAASGGTRTHDRLLARRRSYQLSYLGNSAGWA